MPADTLVPQAADTTPYLFVYGTLKPDAGTRMGRAERARLIRESVNEGSATTSGRLYDLGGFPGFQLAPSASDSKVHGTLLRLVQPARTLIWLDAYEDVASGLYRRVLVPVVPHDARCRAVQAATYLFNAEIGRKRAVIGGVWPVPRTIKPGNKM